MWGRKCRSFFVIESSREETGSAKDEDATDADAEDDDYKDEDEDEEYLDEEEEGEDPEAGRCRQKKSPPVPVLILPVLTMQQGGSGGWNQEALKEEGRKDSIVLRDISASLISHVLVERTY